VARARRGEGPTLIECRAARYYGHFEGDTQTYRAEEEVEHLRREHDPLTNFRTQLRDVLTPADFEAVDATVIELLDEAVEQARLAPEPTGADLSTDVYASY
jgi:pyruvate dehydrogenase E1 component alpha subunit